MKVEVVTFITEVKIKQLTHSRLLSIIIPIRVSESVFFFFFEKINTYVGIVNI
jgi:hypothetical protein